MPTVFYEIENMPRRARSESTNGRFYSGQPYVRRYHTDKAEAISKARSLHAIFTMLLEEDASGSQAESRVIRKDLHGQPWLDSRIFWPVVLRLTVREDLTQKNLLLAMLEHGPAACFVDCNVVWPEDDETVSYWESVFGVNDAEEENKLASA